MSLQHPFHQVPAIGAFAVVAALAASAPATAQSPINAPGAMQPSTNTGIFHVMPIYRELGSDPTSGSSGGEQWILLTQIAYGMSSSFSVQLDAPLVWSERDLGARGDDDDLGFGDVTLLGKYRIFQDDPGPTDTTRFSLIGGVQIPGSVEYEMDSSNDAWDPIVGGVFSTVRGRHGFNASALYEFYTGSDDDHADSLRYDLSYLYRLAPPRYTAETTGAWYGVVELNGFYGTNGDHELYLSPGVMYEARRFTIDAAVMIPVHQEVDHRAESELIIGAGVRLSF